MTSILHYEQDELGVVTLTLNHPETRNALTGTGLVEALLDACQRIETDPVVRAVIITSSGSIFSSGGKIDEMERQIGPDYSSADLRQEYRHGIQRLPLAIHGLEVPTIAAVTGGWRRSRPRLLKASCGSALCRAMAARGSCHG